MRHPQILSSATIALSRIVLVPSVGTLSTTDPDSGDTHTYSVNDNRFEVVGNQLRLKSGVSLNYEAAAAIILSITATDGGGLTRTEGITIFVGDVNEAPQDIFLAGCFCQ